MRTSSMSRSRSRRWQGRGRRRRSIEASASGHLMNKSSAAALRQRLDLARVDLQHHPPLVDRLNLRRVDETVAAGAGSGVEDDPVEDVRGAIAEDAGDAPEPLPVTRIDGGPPL